MLFDKDLNRLVRFPQGKAGSYDIPDGVVAIGNSAFADCANLATVTIPNSITNIEGAAFIRCRNLTDISIPDSVTGIGVSVFFGCVGMTNVAIPGSVTAIGDYAFFGCASLLEITIPSGVTSIGNSVFARCVSLTNVMIPDSLTSIATNRMGTLSSFSGCTNLTAIEVDPENPVYSSLEGVLFDKGQTTLLQCPSGKEGAYAIPGSVTRIGISAFSFCSGLTHVAIPGSVASIGNEAFKGFRPCQRRDPRRSHQHRAVDVRSLP